VARNRLELRTAERLEAVRPSHDRLTKNAELNWRRRGIHPDNADAQRIDFDRRSFGEISFKVTWTIADQIYVSREGFGGPHGDGLGIPWILKIAHQEERITSFQDSDSLNRGGTHVT
jgi:hypothetical protein